MFAGAFPRLADVLLWIARPTMFTAAFGGSWVWPLLGVLFLPLTTLFYVFMWSPAGGIQGFDWFWLFIAILLDLSHYAGTAYANRDRVPATIPGGTRSATA
jgi:hypothetical protein